MSAHKKTIIVLLCVVVVFQLQIAVAASNEAAETQGSSGFIKVKERIDEPVSAVSEGIGESDKFRSRIENAIKIFSVERNYSSAAEQFDKLLGVTTRPSDRARIFGLRNASLYALGHHLQALELICKEYAGIPHRDARYLFDIHAHARKISLNEGYDAAIEVMVQFKNKCHRDDFSPVWVAIPLVKMEFLKDQVHVMDEHYVLPAKDRIVLLQIIKKYPNDPYIDYGRYFLHEFDTIDRLELVGIPRGNKRSSYTARNHDEYYLGHQIETAPEHQRPLLTKAVMKGTCENSVQCALVAKWFPNSLTAREMLMQSVYASWQLAVTEQEKGLLNLRAYKDSVMEFAEESTSKSMKDYAKELDYALVISNKLSSEQKRRLLPIYVKWECASTADCLEFLRLFEGSRHSRQIALRHMEDLIYEGQLNEFREFYENLPDGMKDVLSQANKPLLIERQQHLVDIREYLLNQDIDGLLQFAIEIRGRIPKRKETSRQPARYPYMAREIFYFISREYPKTSLGERAHFLSYTTSAHRVGGRDPKEILEQFISLYPNSRLIDDAYAELGVLNERWGGDRELAKFYYEKVWKEYPEKNAADNALYHQAKMEVTHGQYTKAIYHYGLIALHYGQNRLGKIAKNDLAVMEGAYQSVQDRLVLDGLVLLFIGQSNHVSAVDPRAIRSLGGIMKDDELISLNGVEITTQEVFREILARNKPGASLSAVFERIVDTPNGSEKRTIQTTVSIGQASIFDVAFVESNDNLFMRSEPNHRSKEVGVIPYNGECIRYEGETSVEGKNGSPWFKVRYVPPEGKPIVGWVNGLFLRQSSSCMR